ncbi:hypothetical protein BaRGS_00005639 [Batillaria attramentaria]|uniref:Uncharacterized protein n=1 Tax=Batillaria attramentaria TaxID=370345 RepID=A0ABD0LV64_9CAEN
MSASASEGGDVLLNHMVLLPDIHKSGDVDPSAGAGHSVDTVSNCSSAGSEFMGYKHADEASSDDVDSHFHHSQIPSVIPSHSGQEQRCSGIVQMSLCSEGDSETPLAASCAEDRSDNAMMEEIEMNNNLSELHTDDHASFGVPDGHGPLSSMSMTGDQGLRHKQTDKCSNKGTAPYPEMLFSNSFAEVIDSARGNMGLTSLVKSTGARACEHSDMVEDLTEAGSDKDPGAENSNKESQAVGDEPLDQIGSSASGSTSHTKCMGHKPTNGSKETLEKQKTPDALPQKDRPGPVSSKRCRCKVPVPQETISEAGGSARAGERRMCGKCMKRIPLRRPKKQTKSPDICCFSGKHKPHLVLKEHNYSRSARHLSFQALNVLLNETEKHNDENKSQMACDSEVDARESHGNVAVYVFPPKFGSEINTYREEQRPLHLQEPHGVPLKEVEGKRAADSIICCQTMPVQLHKDTCPQALDPACRQSQSESCKTRQEHSCMKNEQNSCGKTEKKVRHKMKPKTKQPKKSEMETIVHNDFAVLDTFGIDPCYVVLERTPGAVHRKARHRPPCPKHCRAESLDFLCEVGKLVHCKHSVSEQSLSVEPDNSKQRLGVFNPKRDCLRHNKTLEGYEEYRQQQLQAIRMKRMKENGVFEGGQIIGNSMDMFFPLSSLCAEGITDTHVSNSSIKTEQGLVGKRKSEESDPRSHCMHSHVRERGQDELTAPGLPKGPKHRPKRKVRVDAQDELGAATNVSSGSHKQLCDDIDEKSHPVDRCLRSDTIERKKAVTEEAEMDKMKMSKFDVKYYVFEADGRAFVVPLIRTSCRVGSVNRLDDEDLLYVKTVISFLLEEKTSCARHLGYHESLKQKRKSRSLTKSERFKPLMVGSVEEFHIECLKIVASDPHVLNLAPQNNKISEIEYLTQLGEEVYLYLTGAMEDAPPWIKELAKKVVAKQRQKIQNKNRLRPSKDVTIEIDYAEECSDIDVGEEEEVSIVNSGISLDVCGLSADGAETQLALATPDADVSYGAVGGVPFTEPVQPGKENTGQPTGSYVSEDVYVQDAKPLLSDLMQVSQTPITGDTAEMPFHGQHISVPLPPSFESVQNSASDWNPHTGLSVVVPSSSEYTTLTQEAEEPDRKPLAHELLAAASVSVPLLEPPQEQFHTQQAGHLHQQQTQEQNPGWPYAIVKQEPPDDYSFALSGGVKEETPAPVPEDSSATGNPVLPFITADTFGHGIVQLEQETQDVRRGEKNVKATVSRNKVFDP